MAEERTKKYDIEFKLYDGTTRSVSIEIPLGEDGKTAYQYALDGGYTGTEAEFAAKLAAESVLTTQQTLTNGQKAQARKNIGAAAEGEGGGASVQSDWNQTDETAPDFLKNKPFGDVLTEIIPETEFVGELSDGVYTVYPDSSVFSFTETFFL